MKQNKNERNENPYNLLNIIQAITDMARIVQFSFNQSDRHSQLSHLFSCALIQSRCMPVFKTAHVPTEIFARFFTCVLLSQQQTVI